MGLKPKSHPVSVITLSDWAELAIVFELSKAVDVSCNLHHCVDEQQEKLEGYTLIAKKQDDVTFNLRFIHTGHYTRVFDVQARVCSTYSRYIYTCLLYFRHLRI